MVKMKMIAGVLTLVTLMLVTLDEASGSPLVTVEPEVISGVEEIETEPESGVDLVDTEAESDVDAVETKKESGVAASDTEDERDSSTPSKKWRCQHYGPWLHLRNRPCFQTGYKPRFYNGWKHVVNVGDMDDDWDDRVSSIVNKAQDIAAKAVSDAHDAVHKIGNVYDMDDDWDDKISSIVNEAQDIAAKAVSDAHDAVHKAFERMDEGNTYHFINGNLMDGTIPKLGKRFRNLFSGYSIMVQIGTDYCIQHLSHARNQVREAEILDVLEQKLADGNKQVNAFFKLLGEKVKSWSYDNMKVETGRVKVYNFSDDEVVHFVNGRPVEEEFQDDDDGKQDMPNFFQDQDVVMQLNQLVDSGVITQEEMELLSQQQN